MASRRLQIISTEQLSSGPAAAELARVGSSNGSSCASNSTHGTTSESPGIIAGRGFAGNVALVTLGCAKNVVDSEVMLGALVRRGFRPVADPHDADLVVVNTCAFLESAVKEGIDTILDLARLKESGRLRKLVVAGCMVERYRQDLEASLPEVDRFLSTDELLSVGDDGHTSDSCFEESRRPYFLYDESMPRIRSTGGHSAFVKIAEGCDRPCAFCIIPKIRGAFRSRPVSSVLAEVQMLLADGVREFNLVAQDLTSYGRDLQKLSSQDSLLPELLSGFSGLQRDPQCGADRKFWVRLFYAYPIGVNERLIREIVESPVVCNYLDLPIQHISNSVLKSMRRPLGERGTRGLIEQLRGSAPELALRTTFIVGFPGETESDFELLRSFVAEGHFAHVGAFTYSQEKEADSFHHPNQLPERVKTERRKILMETQQAVVRKRLEGYIGKQIPVLVEGAHSESDLLLVGRTEWQGPETDGEVIINDVAEADLSPIENGSDDSGPGASAFADRLKGEFVTIEVTEVAGYDLVGRVVT